LQRTVAKPRGPPAVKSPKSRLTGWPDSRRSTGKRRRRCRRARSERACGVRQNSWEKGCSTRTAATPSERGFAGRGGDGGDDEVQRQGGETDDAKRAWRTRQSLCSASSSSAGGGSGSGSGDSSNEEAKAVSWSLPKPKGIIVPAHFARSGGRSRGGEARERSAGPGQQNGGERGKRCPVSGRWHPPEDTGMFPPGGAGNWQSGSRSRGKAGVGVGSFAKGVRVEVEVR